ncbi:MAG: hypothetical protein MJZ29_08465 [Bacteroidaceae bacterium]|nr:hypothetical protein [Bacteroidaceae bacterium]
MKKKYIAPKSRSIKLDSEDLMLTTQSIPKGAVNPYQADPSTKVPMDAREVESGVSFEYYPADPTYGQD